MVQRGEESRYAPPEARLSEPGRGTFTWGRTLWLVWSLGWRSTLLNMPVSMAAGVLQSALVAAPLLLGLALLAQIALGLLIQLGVARRVFGRSFRTFGVRVSPSGEGPTWPQALAIWWCYTWRTSALTLPLAALVAALIVSRSPAIFPLVLLVFPLFLWLSLVVFRSALRKEYSGFWLEIVGT